MPFTSQAYRSHPLYGREREKDFLLRSYESAKEGGVSLVAIGGPSGVGKSMLARSLSDRVLMDRGVFAAGKFNAAGEDGFQNAFAKLLQDITRQVLAWEQPNLAALCGSLTPLVASTARILTDLSPDLSLVLGSFPPLPALDPHEARNRFQRTIADFLRVFGELNYTMVLLLDDLQWADTDSISLLNFLISDPVLKSILWLGTTRDNPERVKSMLETGLQGRKSTPPGAFAALDLQPWNRDELTGFLAYALQANRQGIASLGDLIYSKSRGNPFYASQLLKNLSAEFALRRDAGKNEWVWDALRIKKLPVADAVADLIRDRAFRLSAKAQECLRIAACLGYEFQLGPLSDVLGIAQEVLVPLLEECIEAELLVSLSDGAPAGAAWPLAFQHDQIRQSIYGLIPPAERKKIHLRIARRLWIQHGEVAGNVFASDIADHLIEAMEEVDSPEERIRIAIMALKAAQSARDEAGFSLALRRCQGGIGALQGQPWASQYSLLFGLHRLGAECAYLTGNFEVSERYFDLLVENASCPLDRAQVYSVRMALCEHSLDHSAALQFGDSGLRLLGVRLPKKPGMASLVLPLVDTLWRLRFHPPAQSAMPDRAPTEENLVAMRILSNTWTAAFLSGNDPLQGLAVFAMVRISLRNGLSEFSSFAWICFAVFRSSVMQAPEKGYQLAEFALRLADNFGNPMLIGRVRFLFATFFNHHRNPFRDSFDLAQTSFTICRNAGDWLYAGYCNDMKIYFMLVQGFSLKRIELESREIEAFARASGHTATLENLAILKRRSTLLGGSAMDRNAAMTEDLSASAIATDKAEKGFFLLCEWQMSIFFQRWNLARKISSAIRGNPLLDPSGCFFAEFLVFESLTEASFHAGASPWEKRRITAKLAKHAASLESLSVRCAENFEHSHALVLAELHRLEGRHDRASAEYERSILSAEKSGFPHYVAVASERAGSHCLSMNRPKAAGAYLAVAHNAYRGMGAAAKAEELRRNHPDLVRGKNFDSDDTDSVNRADFLGVMQAAHAISSEIILPRLVKNLMEILSRMSKAERVLLLFLKEAEFVVGGESSSRKRKSRDGDTCLFPVAVANYVARTERAVVLPDPDFDFLFKMDAYLVQCRPKSALCLPMVHQGKLLSLLYLENESEHVPFDAGRTQLLQLLANQAAISLANARFHALQLEAQQSKINPHFLFNVLSSIAEMSVTDGIKAEKAILRLADLYRYILHQSADHLVELERELEIVSSYMELEKMRLGSKLAFNLEVFGEVAAVRLPGLLIQPLVENCVKHGIAPKMGPGCVDVTIDIAEGKCRISVRDDGIGGKTKSSSGPGFGLKSVQERLALVYGEGFSFSITSDSGFHVEIEIPMLPNAIHPAVASVAR